jgi:hypothetical protein
MVSSELTSGNVWKTCVTPNDGALDGTETCSNNVTITSALVDVYDLSLIYTNSSHYSVLRFFMRNIANYSNLFNWSLYTGESRINSTMPTNLTAGENIFALIEHNYTSSGTKTLVANGTTANDKDSDMIIAAIG